jgi:mannose-6-phosphate isomerase class I
MFSSRPYLIIPKLIEQSTWGGTYILQLKNWSQKTALKDKKIGQSYELFGDSKLAISITDTDDPRFIPEFGFADKPDTIKENFNLTEHTDYVTLSHVVTKHPEEMIGKKILEKYGNMPLLIKLNQAAGNSFQIHVKPGTSHERWKPKPESWYYLEDGMISCGIKDGIDLKEYKDVCVTISATMKKLSTKVKNGEMTLNEAKQQARKFITQKNPWQFVNTYEVNKYDLIDLSIGGIHHSWEENKEKFPLGNIVYEVQLDVMDPLCTIRSFDQGKLKDDGTIRDIHIDDYFQFLDTTPENNNINNLRKTQQGQTLLKTPYYCVDIIELLNDGGTREYRTEQSFNHVYVRDGHVQIHTDDGTSIKIKKGHSCFIPAAISSYEIKSLTPESVVLKTFIEN